ncbi:phosphoribosyltransferase [Peristeroidobacter soli]|uniref:phosphoribosyltransferase n=1 Tax=Peristeroidobacter soli TaxID=2497877 RepID=UPI001C37C010|nr:phosphoribosyltransferase [Peristeroidobacter soli]
MGARSAPIVHIPEIPETSTRFPTTDVLFPEDPRLTPDILGERGPHERRTWRESFPELAAMNDFSNRTDAGRTLADLLTAYREREDAIVLGLPRGGVPVAFEVSKRLNLPLDVMVVRKLRAPGQPELAVGAIASGGISVLNEDLASLLCDPVQLRAELQHQNQELQHRENLYRNGRLPLDIKRRAVILVDDGAATGASMRAAIRAARKFGAARVIAAVPVASSDAVTQLSAEADEVVCALQPDFFQSVADWYRDFEQTDDSEVTALIAQSRGRPQRIAHAEH